MKSNRPRISFENEAAAVTVPQPHIVVGKVKRKKAAAPAEPPAGEPTEENCPVLRANQVFFTGRSEGGLRVVCF